MNALQTTRILISTALLLLSFNITAQESSYPRSYRYSFTNINQSDGLSDNDVTYAIDDRRGMIWIGTNNGLNVLSNNQISKYSADESNPNSLPDNRIVFIAQTNADIKDNRKWIATRQGLCVYMPTSDAFMLVKNAQGKPILTTNYIHYGDNILFGCSTGEILSFDSRTDTFKCVFTSDGRFPVLRMQPYAPDPNKIIAACAEQGLRLVDITDGTSVPLCKADKYLYAKHTVVADNGNIWLCGETLLAEYTPEGKPLRYYHSGQNGIGTCKFVGFTQLNGVILVATKGDGVLWIDTENGYAKGYAKHRSGDQNSPAGNYINHIKISTVGEFIFVSSARGGLDIVKRSNIISYGEVTTGCPYGLSFQTVLSLYDDRRTGKIYIATDGGGVNTFNPRTERFSHIPIYANKAKIESLIRYDSDSFLVSVANDGLYILNEHSGRMTPYGKLSEYLNTKFYGGTAWVKLTDGDGDTFYIVGPEIIECSKSTGRYRVLEREGNNAAESSFNIGSTVGIQPYILLHTRHRVYKLYKKSFTLECIYRSEYEIIDAATGTSGLIICDRNGVRQTVDKSYTTTKPLNLFGYVAKSVIIDNDARLWIAANSVIIGKKSNSNDIHTFSTTDGVIPEVFITKARLVASDGNIYFGGVTGFTFIERKVEFVKSTDPDMQLISINSESDIDVQWRGDVREIRVPYDFNSVTMRFSAAGYDILKPNKFKFTITGPQSLVNENMSDNLRFVFKKAGEYNVMGSCGTGVGTWTEPKLLAIVHVDKPWWLEIWFLGTIFAIVLAITISVVKRRVDNKQQQYNQLLREQEQALQDEKMNMYVNISHEIRTPLTLIYAPLKRIIQELPDSNAIRQKLEQIMAQVMRLTQLTELIFDVRKMDMGFTKLVIKPNENVNNWIENLLQAFLHEFEHKNIILKFLPSPDIHEATFDTDKIEIVINNLVSNAYKYSNNDTTTIVSSELISMSSMDYMRISVVNEGIGLNGIDVDHIFEKFYRGNNIQSIGGYGVGLSYAADIVKLHRGHITAFDADGKTTFYFEIPMNLPVTDAAEITAGIGTSITAQNMTSQPKAAFDRQRLINCSLLVVEDEKGLREYMKSEFSEYFRKVYTADNGREGLERAKEFHPDIVISDVVMPEMNGFELCKTIKTDLDISHIPVILLTARVDPDSVNLGYKMGADMYIPKPFDVDNLLNILYNHMLNRDQIRRKYQEQGVAMIDDKEATFSNADEKFMDKMNKIIMENLDNSLLDINLLTSEMGLSRTNFYSKLKNITDITPIAYINKMRIQRAVELLKTSDSPISEVAIMVGFTDHAYFSSIFKDVMGVSPKAFRAGGGRKGGLSSLIKHN